MMRKVVLFFFLSLGIHTIAAQSDPFLTGLYDQLYASPLQQKMKAIAPFPVGVVYVQRPDENEPEMRAHFRTMKKLGYNCLKQIMTIPGWTIEQVQLIALDEGIIPWWYGEGGWETISDKLLQKLGIPENTPISKIRSDAKMLAYQQGIMKNRILKSEAYTQKNGSPLKGHSTAFEPEVGGRGFDLTDKGKLLFEEWVKNKYGTIDQLNIAWNQFHVGLQPAESNRVFQSWQDFSDRYKRLGNNEYAHLKDILSFKVTHSVEAIKERCEIFRQFDSNAVFRGGGELGLFHPLPYYGVNMESIANLMKDYGSFYPSIHYAWHYAETAYELVRPFYMQASLANDFFKGGWAATWESTGGPQQFSGGKGGASFTVDAGNMTQFLLSQIAAGFKGWGTWTWSVRTAGWEAGEYGLLDRNNQVTDRAIKVGLIGKKANELRDELWQLRKEPTVGILYDWDSEALWTTMTQSGRDEFKEIPVQARIGISRALINQNIPFEYVTAVDLRKGLAARYKVIYLPEILGLSEDLLPILKEYVMQGGRLVMDAPTAYYDQRGVLFNTVKGSAFEQLFGAVIQDYQGAGVNRNYSLHGLFLKGFITTLDPTTAEIVAKYDDGGTAVTENKIGKGTAVILGYEAAAACFKKGNDHAEKNVLKYTLGKIKAPYTCKEAIVYRLAGKNADHYFLINDGGKKKANLQFSGYQYKKIKDVLSNKELTSSSAIDLDANSGRWIRCEK